MLRVSFRVFLACALVAATPALAVTFSFASDDNHDGPTFQGHSGGSMPDDFNEASAFSVDAIVNVDLMVDLNHDVGGGIVIFPSEFTFDGTISNYTLDSRGGNWVHSWDVSGSFNFRHAGTGQLLLVVRFENALLTTLSPSPGSLGETATLQDSEGVDSGISFQTFTLLQGIGVPSSAVTLSEDFAFTMTRIRRSTGIGLPFIDHGEFLNGWISEGSFSAHATGFSPADPDEEAVP